jgi:hypothetical protein
MSFNTFKHTSLPWRADKAGFVTDKDDNMLAECEHPDMPERANALFIAKAVNSHYELVEALQHAMTFLESLPKGWLSKTSGDIGALNEFYCVAPRALKKAV